MPPTSLSHELRTIAASLRSIQTALERLGPAIAPANAAVPAPAGHRSPLAGRKLKLSPARRAALKLQGQYMGYLRGLKPAQKNSVKALAAAKGIAAAVVMARKLAQG